MMGRLARIIAAAAAAATLGGASWVDPQPAAAPAPLPNSGTSAAPAETLQVAGWSLSGGRLTLLFHGTAAAVDRLRNDGRLAIEVHWLQGGPDDAPGPVTELPVGSPHLASALAGEVEHQGFFTWHSWVRRRGSSSGAFLTWPDGSPVSCPSEQGACRLSFNRG